MLIKEVVKICNARSTSISRSFSRLQKSRGQASHSPQARIIWRQDGRNNQAGRAVRHHAKMPPTQPPSPFEAFLAPNTGLTARDMRSNTQAQVQFSSAASSQGSNLRRHPTSRFPPLSTPVPKSPKESCQGGKGPNRPEGGLSSPLAPGSLLGVFCIGRLWGVAGRVLSVTRNGADASCGCCFDSSAGCCIQAQKQC